MFQVRENTEGVTIDTTSDNVSHLRVDTSLFASSTVSLIAENNLGLDESGARLTVEEVIAAPCFRVHCSPS